MSEATGAFDLLWSMPIDDRNVAFLHYCEGMDTNEIANLLGKEHKTVSSRISSARKMMREHL